MAVYASLEYLNIKEACIRCQIESAIRKTGMVHHQPSVLRLFVQSLITMMRNSPKKL